MNLSSIALPSRRGILSLIAVVALLATLVAAFPAHAASSETLRYWVKRDGTPIGEHIVAFQRDGDKLTVSLNTDLAVKVAFITAFRFEHTSTETWKGNRLLALSSRTNDDGTNHEVSAAAGPDGLTVVADGVSRVVPADTLVHDQWNPANLQRNTLLSIFDGQPMQVAFTQGPTEAVDVNGTPVEATRWESSGDLQRTFWFDADDRLVKVRFESRGSTVTYELR